MRCPVCHDVIVECFCTVFDRVRNRPEEMWDILRCTHCGFGWTHPPLAEDEIHGRYPPAYLGDTTHALEEFLSGKLVKSRSWKKELEKVELVQRYSPSGKVLDVGCGEGRFLWALDPLEWHRTGVDSSRETVALVVSRMPTLNLHAGDIFDNKFSAASFDVITFWHVLEHLPRPRAVIGRASELLSPGGWLFISLPNLSSLQARIFRQQWYAFDDVPRHLHHFSLRALEMLLSEAGLCVHRHLPFSPLVNMHCLKHSLRNWCEARWSRRFPYYLLKPLLFAGPLLERITRKYGILTTIARKPTSS